LTTRSPVVLTARMSFRTTAAPSIVSVPLATTLATVDASTVTVEPEANVRLLNNLLCAPISVQVSFNVQVLDPLVNVAWSATSNVPFVTLWLPVPQSNSPPPSSVTLTPSSPIKLSVARSNLAVYPTTTTKPP